MDDAMLEACRMRLKRSAERLCRGLSILDSDLIQEVMVEYAQRSDSVQRFSPEQTDRWFRTVLVNKAVDQSRKEKRAKRDRERECSAYGLDERVPGPDPSPPEVAERSEAAAGLRHELSRLTPQQQEIVRLVFWEGMPEAAIARQLGCTPASVSRCLSRAMRQLAKRIDSPG